MMLIMIMAAMAIIFSALSMLHWCSGEEEGRGQEDLYNPERRGQHGKCQQPPPDVPPPTLHFSALSMLHWCSGEEEDRGQEDLYNPERRGQHGKCQQPPPDVPPPTLHFSALSMLHWCSGEDEGRGQEDLYNPERRGQHGKCQQPPPDVPPPTLQRWTAVAGMQGSYCQPWHSPWHLDGTGKHHRGTSDDWVCKKLCRWPGDDKGKQSLEVFSSVYLVHYLFGDPLRILCVWPIWAEVTCYLGNDTVISSLSIDRQLNIRITTWPKLGNRQTKRGKIDNKTTKHTGRYFIVVEVSTSERGVLHIVT